MRLRRAHKQLDGQAASPETLLSGKEFAKLRGAYVRDGVLLADYDRHSAGLGNGRGKACQTGERDRNPDDDEFRLRKIPFKT